ncbi:MAG: bifunctional phosphoribosylaminoimidazolecarboxamide formyltransferase/IMP cyclohydrolase, partial [Pseudomonadota bacterium]
VTGFPEIMDGRVKTLHPSVHGGLLGIRDADDHGASMAQHGIPAIDLLVVNLYPFEQVMGSGAADEQIVENIDIGGPAMLRAAAKNHAYVTVLTDPKDYDGFLKDLETNKGGSLLADRKQFAQAVYARTAAYDAAISNWMAERFAIETPPSRAFGGALMSTMRYGENPHQNAALYSLPDGRVGVPQARQIQGKQLSYNNINDTDAAFELVSEFDPVDGAAVAIIKHANPCGVAVADTLVGAYQQALACDPVSAFGGIIACNTELDEETAQALANIFTEVIIAPGASDAAQAVLAAKKNLRLLLTPSLGNPAQGGLTFKPVSGGLLVQQRDNGVLAADDLRCVTKRAPSEQELRDLRFAFKVAKHVKSNAIVYAKDGVTAGIGAGQMSRVDSTRIAALKAQDAADAAGWGQARTKGSVVASDAFFPFADGLVTAAEAGATALIQPGGSMRDDEVIAAADDLGLAMVFTGMRHFRH